MIAALKTILGRAVSEITGQQSPDIAIQSPPSGFGDFSTPIAFGLAKQLRQNPSKIAERLAAAIDDPLIKTADTEGGFVNIRVSDRELETWLDRQFLSKELTTFESKNQIVQVEFVSANPTGPLHIGHARGAVVGDSLAKILSKFGYSVKKEYYLNNRGRQMRLLGESVRAVMDGKAIPDDGYKGSYISDVADKIDRTDTTEQISAKASDIILEGIKEDLAEFSITMDNFFSERELIDNGNISKLFDFLQQKELIYEEGGAIWFKSSMFGDDKDRVLKKSNGDLTYFASDIYYHYNKFIIRKFDKVIDVWGADHHGYVGRMKAACRAIGIAPERLSVVLVQIVNLLREGEPFSMSTRSGQFVTLKELIDEVNPDAARFLFLTRKVTSHLDFDVEIAKKQVSENPVFYVQYAYARTRSIFKKALEQKVKYNNKTPLLAGDIGKLERALMIELACYKDAIAKSALQLDPFYLSSYLLDIAKLFHQFYHEVRILGGEKNMISSRLRLCDIASYIIADGLKTLGISHPERM